MTRSTTSAQVVDVFRRYGLAVLVFTLVLAFTLNSYHATILEEREAAGVRFQQLARQHIAQLRERTEGLVTLSEVMRRHVAQAPRIDEREFADFVAPLRAHYPEIRRLGVLRLSGDDALVSVSVESDGEPPSGAAFVAPSHLPDEPSRTALRQLIVDTANGEAGVASHLHTQRQGKADDGDDLLLLAPVKSLATPHATAHELVFIEVPLSRLLREMLVPATGEGRTPLEFELIDADDGAHRLFATPNYRLSDQSYAEAIQLYGRRWLLIAAPDARELLLDPGPDAGAQLFSGLSLGLLAALILYVLQTRADAIRKQVTEKTLALADANEALGQYISALAETNRLLETEVEKHARSEALLRETTSLQRAILDCAEYAIVYTDSNGIIRVVNPAAERLFGHSAEELVGLETPLVFHTAEDIARWTLAHRNNGFAALAEEASASNHTEPREINLRRRDGSIFPANIAISVVHDSRKQIRGYLGIIADITQRRAAESRIRHLAHYDNLTSLPNRTLLNEHLAEAIGLASQLQRGVAVLFTDLDRFKFVNDTLGHQAGDQLLLLVAQRLRACVRDGDLVARTGGDEFVVVLGDLEEGSMPEDVAERILTSLARPFDLSGQQCTVTPSIGIALYPGDGLDGHALIKNADAAMYLAKERGRNNYQFFDHSLSARYSERLELENRLRQAVDANQLELFYQPQVDTLSGELIGLEALIRWRQPDGTMVSPDVFIPIAEECGLIVPIGAWVLHEACRQNHAWLQEGICRVPVGVNLSARQFDDADLLDTIKAALAGARLPPAYLDLELTESLVMRNPEHTRSLLAECKKLGLQLSVDDFGTGYSSLANLKRFPIDRLKIDRSFIKDIVSEPDDAAIAQTIVAMAHTLRLEVIAEGVETEAQLALLRRWRCDAYQGYLCSKPISATEMTSMLRGLRASRLVSLTPL
ncbi:MAG: EAL domain-containing protein [Proteobacteria bacterium]|nr:EAL domain-containing protein [Pseudomonadota bacterium]